MTLTSTTIKLSYNGDAIQNAFPITYDFWDPDDIDVYLRDENVTPAVETLLIRGTHYIVIGGAGTTGSIEMITPPTSNIPAVGEEIWLVSNIPYVQNTALPLGGKFPSISVEEQMDKLTRMIQQLSIALDGVPRTSVTSSDSALTFPDPEFGKFIVWNSTLDGFDNTDVSLATLAFGDDVVFNDVGNENTFRIESDESTHLFYLDGGTGTQQIGFGTDNLAPTDGFIHVQRGNVPGVTASPFCDTMVLESTETEGGLTLIGLDDTFINICFESPTWTPFGAGIFFDTDTVGGSGTGLPRLSFTVNGSEYLALVWDDFDHTSTGVFVNQAQDADINFQVNTSASAPFFQIDAATSRMGLSQGVSFAPTDGVLHIHKGGSAGAISAIDGQDHIVLESDTDSGITFFGPDTLATHSIIFGTDAAVNAGSIIYDHTTALPQLTATVEGTTPTLQVTDGNLTVADVGAAITTRHGVIHAYQGDSTYSGATQPSFNCLVLESDQLAGMTFISSPGQYAGMSWADEFGGAPRASRGQIVFKADSDAVGGGRMEFRIDDGNNARMYMTGTRTTINPLSGFFTNDFSVEGFSGGSNLLYVNTTNANNRVSMSNVPVIGTDGVLHIIESGLAGSVVAATTADCLVLESDAANGLSILTPANVFGGIYWGSPTSNQQGIFGFRHNTDEFQMFIQGAPIIYFGLTEISTNPVLRNDVDFRINGTTSTTLLFSDSSADRIGISNASVLPTDGTLHIINGDAGVIAASANSDELVIEGIGEIGVQFLVDNATGFANINFGDPSNGATAGQIRYDANAASWSFSSTGTELMGFAPGTGVVVNESGAAVHDFRVETSDSTHTFFIDSGTPRIGFAKGVNWAPSDGFIHVFNGGAGGAVTAATTADTLVLESNASQGLSILSTAILKGSILFGSPTSNARGEVSYDHNTDFLLLGTSDLPAVRFDGDQNALFGTISAAAASSAGNLHIPIDTSPTAGIAGGIVVGSKDSSAGSTDATVELWLETAPVAVGTFTPSHKIPIWINGVEYHIQLDAV